MQIPSCYISGAVGPCEEATCGPRAVHRNRHPPENDGSWPEWDLQVFTPAGTSRHQVDCLMSTWNYFDPAPSINLTRCATSLWGYTHTVCTTMGTPAPRVACVWFNFTAEADTARKKFVRALVSVASCLKRRTDLNAMQVHNGRIWRSTEKTPISTRRKDSIDRWDGTRGISIKNFTPFILRSKQSRKIHSHLFYSQQRKTRASRTVLGFSCTHTFTFTFVALGVSSWTSGEVERELACTALWSSVATNHDSALLRGSCRWHPKC